MKSILIILFIAAGILLFITAADLASSEVKAESSGEALFNKHCSLCHPDGGNKIRPEKPLSRKSLEANGIKTPADIINIMRNPGKGMMEFTKDRLSDDDARKTAEYILEAFK